MLFYFSLTLLDGFHLDLGSIFASDKLVSKVEQFRFLGAHAHDEHLKQRELLSMTPHLF